MQQVKPSSITFTAMTGTLAAIAMMCLLACRTTVGRLIDVYFAINRFYSHTLQDTENVTDNFIQKQRLLCKHSCSVFAIMIGNKYDDDK